MLMFYVEALRAAHMRFYMFYALCSKAVIAYPSGREVRQEELGAVRARR